VVIRASLVSGSIRASTWSRSREDALGHLVARLHQPGGGVLPLVELLVATLAGLVMKSTCQASRISPEGEREHRFRMVAMLQSLLRGPPHLSVTH
jgi:hypothetical protein